MLTTSDLLIYLFCTLAFASATCAGPRATAVRVDAPGGKGPGNLLATIAGAEVQVASGALQAWLLEDGASIAYTGHEGAGGYENEGQSLHIHDVGARSTRLVGNLRVGR